MPGSSTGLLISTPQLLNPQATWIPLKLGPSHLPRQGRYTKPMIRTFIQWHNKLISFFFGFVFWGGWKGLGGFFELLKLIWELQILFICFLRYFFPVGEFMELLWLSLDTSANWSPKMIQAPLQHPEIVAFWQMCALRWLIVYMERGWWAVKKLASYGL